jgi:hypothetical protein
MKAWLIQPPRWRRYVPPKRRLTFNRLNGVIFQEIVFFITTTVRTSNPAEYGVFGGMRIGRETKVIGENLP